MRNCNIKISNDGQVTVSQVTEYVEEHGATQLVITLNNELKSDSISYYTLCFKPGAALKNPPDVKITSDMIELSDDGTLTYPLPSSLTAFGSLDVQVQAHIIDANGIMASLIKSPVFRLSFEPSITGDEEFIIGEDDGFISLIHSALAQLNLTVEEVEELYDRLTEAYENGEFNGKDGKDGKDGEKGEKGDKGDKGDKGESAEINGQNTVTLKGGKCCEIVQDGETLTLNIDGVPVYHTLPERADDGDICLYSPANTLNASDSAKKIHVDWEEFYKALAVTDAQFNINFLSADGNICGQLYATSFNGEEGTDKFFQYTNGNEEWQLSFRNDVFAPDESVYIKNEEMVQLDTLPESFILPVFTSTDTDFNDINGDVFYAPLKLMVYRGGWNPLGGGNGDLTDYYTKQEIDNKGFITAEDIRESGVSSLSYDNHLRVQWHRGYVLDAPEHTMASFVSTVKHGCKYIEVDLQFTKDGEIVLLHDSTIDRTSNGSGSINNLTLAQARQYDFGSWFNAKFADEKIPTLEEFIKFCKSTGLYPYLEVKGAVPFTETHLKNIVDTVNKNGMRGKVTYVSINLSHLTTIKNYDPEARLELSSYGITETLMTNANSLKTDKNEVSVDCNFADITDEGVNLCIANNIPLVAWVVDTEAQLLSMHPYISEIITNKLDANKVLYENAMSCEIGGGDEPTNPDVPDEPDEPTDDGFIEWENDTIVLTADDIWYNRNIINQSPHTANETGKAIAKEFAIPIDGTYKITVSMESTYDAPLWGWTFFNQTVYNNYLSNNMYSSTDCSINSVWEENNATVAVPETINSLPTIGVRLNFLLNRSRPSMDSTNFSKVTITRTKIVNE